MMARSPHYKANNEGGYGNPPVKNQFDGKPGPGRPKGSTSLEGSLRKVFRRKLSRVGKDGKRTKVDAPDALAERALELGLKGPLSANIEARKLAEKYGPQDEQTELDLSRLTRVELELYGYLATKVLGDVDAEPDQRWKRMFKRIEEIVEEEAQRRQDEYWAEMRRPALTQRLERDPDDELGE